jgi:hypothetical protein
MNSTPRPPSLKNKRRGSNTLIINNITPPLCLMEGKRWLKNYSKKALEPVVILDIIILYEIYSLVKHEAGKLAPLNKLGVAVLVQEKRTAMGIFTLSDVTITCWSFILASAG